MAEDQERDTAKSQELVAEYSRDVDVLSELDTAFNRGGIPSFVLEGVLRDLQQRASAFLQDLAPGMSLELKAQTAGKGSADVMEKISKVRGQGVLMKKNMIYCPCLSGCTQFCCSTFTCISAHHFTFVCAQDISVQLGVKTCLLCGTR